MTRKTIKLPDPMPALREARKAAVNENFSKIAATNLQRDMAHAAKRIEAQAIVGGAVASAEFAAEAELRGITPLELANVVLSKPNEAAQRELRRQQIHALIEAAKTEPELNFVDSSLFIG